MKPKVAVFAISVAFSLLMSAAFAQDAESCGVCHRGVYQDWLQSRHSLAWKSPEFQAQMARFGNPQFCGRCHAPATVWEKVNLRPEKEGEVAAQSYDPNLVDKSVFREELPEDGVACGSCHLIRVLWPNRTGDEFLGPYHSEAGHGGKAASQFQSFELCGTCHGRQRADYTPKDASTLTGFHHSKTSPLQFATKDVNCGQCHMPQRQERLVQLKVFKSLPERAVGEHTFSGVRYQELGNALDFAIQTDTNGAALVVTNARVGHAPKTQAETRYKIVLTKLDHGERNTSQTVDFSEAGNLLTGQSLRIPLEFVPGGPGSVQIELIRGNTAGFEEKLFSKIL